MGELVEATVSIDGTVYNRTYTCDHAAVSMYGHGLTVVIFTNGRDDQGPITSVCWADAHEVVKRPIGGDE